MVVQALRHQLQRQRVLRAARLFDFGAFVLKPDLNLRLVQIEFVRERLPPLLRDVPVQLKLGFQSLQLLGRERRSGSLILRLALLILQFPGPRALCGDNKETKP